MGARGPEARGYSEKLAEVMTTILGNLSYEQLEIRAEGEASFNTFRRLKAGKIPGSRILGVVARRWTSELCRHYGDEITADGGECNADTAQAWLHRICYLPPMAEPTQDEVVARLRGFRGAEDLPEEDLSTLGAMVSAYINERRRQRGLE